MNDFETNFFSLFRCDEDVNDPTINPSPTPCLARRRCHSYRRDKETSALPFSLVEILTLFSNLNF